MTEAAQSQSRYCGVSIVGPGVDTQCRVESEDDLQIVVAQIRKALGVRSERGLRGAELISEARHHADMMEAQEVQPAVRYLLKDSIRLLRGLADALCERLESP